MRARPLPSSDGAANGARPRGYKCRPKSCRLHSLFPLLLHASLTFSRLLSFLRFCPFSLSLHLASLSFLAPSILCLHVFRGSWSNRLRLGNRRLRSACVRVCVHVTAQTHAWRQTWIYCFYSREGPPVIGSSPRLMSSRLRCLFFAPQHKRFLFLERLNESRKKNFFGGGGGFG